MSANSNLCGRLHPRQPDYKLGLRWLRTRANRNLDFMRHGITPEVQSISVKFSTIFPFKLINLLERNESIRLVLSGLHMQDHWLLIGYRWDCERLIPIYWDTAALKSWPLLPEVFRRTSTSFKPQNPRRVTTWTLAWTRSQILTLRALLRSSTSFKSTCKLGFFTVN